MSIPPARARSMADGRPQLTQYGRQCDTRRLSGIATRRLIGETTVKPIEFVDRRGTVHSKAALHPGDEDTTGKPSEWYPVGMDCAKRIGLEWTHAEKAKS